MNSPLATRALTKQFGDHLALNALTLEIPAGRIVGLLGRNGAGKSTLINLACGLLLPTSGSCLTLGQASGDLDVPQLEHLGAVFQEGRFLDWMTVRQHLDYTASFYSKWDVSRERRLLDELDLDVSRKIIQLSAGDQPTPAAHHLFSFFYSGRNAPADSARAYSIHFRAPDGHE